MTISIYLIRLLVAFIFGASVLMNIIGIYCGISENWDSINQSSTLAVHILVFVIFLGSGYFLWMIK